MKTNREIEMKKVKPVYVEYSCSSCAYMSFVQILNIFLPIAQTIAYYGRETCAR